MSEQKSTEARVATSADSARRSEFKWSANSRRGAINIVRTGQSSPVFMQANN
ncbi:MAG: hypothetical protein ACRDT4_23175 [Micromonosporaceae bacterium]